MNHCHRINNCRRKNNRNVIYYFLKTAKQKSPVVPGFLIFLISYLMGLGLGAGVDAGFGSTDKSSISKISTEFGLIVLPFP